MSLLYACSLNAQNKSILKSKDNIFRLRPINPALPIDTLIHESNNGVFKITPSGLLTFPSGISYQLKIEKNLIVEQASIYQTKGFTYVFHDETNLMEGGFWLVKIDNSNMQQIYKEYIVSVSSGPIIKDNYTYITFSTHAKKIDLETGKNVWYHQDVRNGNVDIKIDLDTIIFDNSVVKFISRKSHSILQNDTIVIDDKIGKIIKTSF